MDSNEDNMPKVPVAQRQVERQVVAAPRSTVRNAGVEAFGGGQQQVAQALGETVNEAKNIYQKHQNDADELKVQNGITDAIKRKNELMHHPETGYLNQKGLSAAESLDKYKETYNSSMQEVEDGLASDNQKLAFKKWRNRQDREIDGQMQRHTFGEVRKYDDERTAAAIDTLSEDAIISYREMGVADENGAATSKLRENMNDIETAIRANGRRQGFSKEVVDNKILAAKSKTHMGVVNRMLANDEDLNAEEYFKQLKDSGEVDSATMDRMSKAVDAGTLRGNSQRETDKILEKGLNQPDSLAAVRADEKLDPKVKDETVRRIKTRFAEKKIVDESQLKIQYKDVYNELISKRTLDHMSQQMAALPPAQQQVLRNIHKNMLNGKDVDDFKVYNDLNTMASSPRLKNKFMNTELSMYADKLSLASLKKFSNLQGQVREQSDKYDGFLSDSQAIDGTLVAAKIPKKIGKKDNPVYLEARAAIDREVEIWKKENNRNSIPNSELNKIAGPLLLSGHVKGSSGFANLSECMSNGAFPVITIDICFICFFLV